MRRRGSHRSAGAAEAAEIGGRGGSCSFESWNSGSEGIVSAWRWHNPLEETEPTRTEERNRGILGEKWEWENVRIV